MFKLGDKVITPHFGPGVVARFGVYSNDTVGVDFGREIHLPNRGRTNDLKLGMKDVEALPGPTGRWFSIEEVSLDKRATLKSYFNG